MQEIKAAMFEFTTVDEAVAKHHAKEILPAATYTTPAIPMYGEPCANPLVQQSHALTHPPVYMAEVNNYKMIGGCAFPIIDNKCVKHQYFDVSEWETWEQAKGNALIKDHLIAYRGLVGHIKLDEKVINLCGNGSFNYAHWMTEFLPQLVLLRQSGIDLAEYKVLVFEKAFPTMLEALSMLGFSQSQLVPIKNLCFYEFTQVQWVSPVSNVVFQRPNANSVGKNEEVLARPCQALFHPEVIKKTRDTFLNLATIKNKENQPEKIFIKRTTGGKKSTRLVVNELEIQQLLENNGFITIDPSLLDFESQISVFSNAKIIVSPSGAALLNMLWAPKGAEVVVLMNNSKVTNYWYFSNIAAALGHKLSYVLGKVDKTGAWRDIYHADFIIDCQHLFDALKAADLPINLPINTHQEGLYDLSSEAVLKYAELLQKHCLFEQATQAYQWVLTQNPGHAKANHNLGIMVAKTAGTLAALPMLKTAIMNQPSHEPFWVSYIDALSVLGAVPDAIDALTLGLNFSLTSVTGEFLGEKLLTLIDKKLVNEDKKRLIALIMRLRHKRLLIEKQQQSKIKVVFLVLMVSAWKLDTVLQAMLTDAFFEPVVLVCPCLSLGHEEMLAELDHTYHHFKKKGLPVINSYIESSGSWVELHALTPDLIFFTNPHPITRPEYYDEAYMNYLSCYVPYDHQVSQYNDNQAQYNQNFHNAMWQIFVPHTESKDIFTHAAVTQGTNVSVTGYPACEPYIDKMQPIKSAWRVQDSKKSKIIWAPHHTIDYPELPYSNFLKYADFFQKLALQYSETVQWAFKPHPLLKSKLYKYAGWGKERTDLYYAFWENQPNTQLESGAYEDLFMESDAMIHDCGSFLAEYLYLKKPVLYLANDINIKDYFNPFGVKAFDACEHAYTKEEIIHFINTFTTLSMSKVGTFYRSHIAPYFDTGKPTAKIIANIKQAFSE